jgi:hypothetical protein
MPKVRDFRFGEREGKIKKRKNATLSKMKGERGTHRDGQETTTTATTTANKGDWSFIVYNVCATNNRTTIKLMKSLR